MGDGFVVFAEGFEVDVDGFGDVGAEFFEGVAGGGAAGEVGDVGGEGAVGGFFDHVGVFHGSISFEARLAENGVGRAGGNVVTDLTTVACKILRKQGQALLSAPLLPAPRNVV